MSNRNVSRGTQGDHAVASIYRLRMTVNMIAHYEYSTSTVHCLFGRKRACYKQICAHVNLYPTSIKPSGARCVISTSHRTPVSDDESGTLSPPHGAIAAYTGKHSRRAIQAKAIFDQLMNSWTRRMPGSHRHATTVRREFCCRKGGCLLLAACDAEPLLEPQRRRTAKQGLDTYAL